LALPREIELYLSVALTLYPSRALLKAAVGEMSERVAPDL